jgi:hypothetical protein
LFIIAGGLLSFASRLVSEPQREKSGETGAQRYDYQALWGLCLIFSHHTTGADYAISFEFHDDIILLNSATAPSLASFYQVKTKTKGHWTLSDLASRKKRRNDPNNGSLPSHIGKLYSNYLMFPNDTDKLFFVSNVPCEFFEAAATECCMTDAKPNVLASMTSKLQAEYASATSAIVDKLLRFIRADLSLHDSSAHLKGKLVEFVSGQLGPVEFNPESVYRTIVEECRLRSKYTGTVANFTDLIQHKSITRDQVSGWLGEIEKAHSMPDWSTIISSLNVSSALQLVELVREWKRYRATALDSGDLSLNIVRDKIRDEIDARKHLGLSLQRLVDDIQAAIEPFANSAMVLLNSSKLKVMIIYEVFGYDTSGKIQTSNTQPANA